MLIIKISQYFEVGLLVWEAIACAVCECECIHESMHKA